MSAGWHGCQGVPGRRRGPGLGRTDRRTGGDSSLRSVVVPRQAWEGVPRAEVANLRSRRAEPEAAYHAVCKGRKEAVAVL